MSNAKRDVACAMVVACAIIALGGFLSGYDGAVILAIVGAVIAGVRVLMLGKEPVKHETPPLTDPLNTILEVTGPDWEWDKKNGGLRPR